MCGNKNNWLVRLSDRVLTLFGGPGYSDQKNMVATKITWECHIIERLGKTLRSIRYTSMSIYIACIAPTVALWTQHPAAPNAALGTQHPVAPNAALRTQHRLLLPTAA